eukprot:scaffold210438_cov30-Tisochrysis_lutea.AAC.2
MGERRGGKLAVESSHPLVHGLLGGAKGVSYGAHSSRWLAGEAGERARGPSGETTYCSLSCALSARGFTYGTTLSTKPGKFITIRALPDLHGGAMCVVAAAWRGRLVSGVFAIVRAVHRSAAMARLPRTAVWDHRGKRGRSEPGPQRSVLVSISAVADAVTQSRHQCRARAVHNRRRRYSAR